MHSVRVCIGTNIFGHLIAGQPGRITPRGSLFDHFPSTIHLQNNLQNILSTLCHLQNSPGRGKRRFCASDPPAQLRQGPPTIWGSGEGGARGEGKGSPLTVTVRAACPWSEGGRVPSLGDRRDVFPWSSGGETCLMAGGRRPSDRRARGIARGLA